MATLPPFNKQLLHPKHWPMWSLMGVWALSAQLPYPWQMAIGDGLGTVMGALGKSRARVARINLEKCFPHLSQKERADLLKANFKSIGRAFMEVSFTWWGNPDTIKSLAHVTGVEHLEKARADGRGVLLVTCHITSLEMAAHLLGLAWPYCYLMYKDNDNPVFEWISQRKRGRHMKELLTHKKVGPFLRAIRENNVGVYMTDQDFRMKYSVFAPFFGVQAATLKTTGDYVRYTNAVVIAAHFGRLPDNKGYYVEFQPPLENFPTDDPVADATRINQITEANILRHPEQYLWQHRRFKHRPPGEPKIY